MTSRTDAGANSDAISTHSRHPASSNPIAAVLRGIVRLKIPAGGKPTFPLHAARQASHLGPRTASQRRAPSIESLFSGHGFLAILAILCSRELR